MPNEILFYELNYLRNNCSYLTTRHNTKNTLPLRVNKILFITIIATAMNLACNSPSKGLQTEPGQQEATITIKIPGAAGYTVVRVKPESPEVLGWVFGSSPPNNDSYSDLQNLLNIPAKVIDPALDTVFYCLIENLDEDMLYGLELRKRQESVYMEFSKQPKIVHECSHITITGFVMSKLEAVTLQLFSQNLSEQPELEGLSWSIHGISDSVRELLAGTQGVLISPTHVFLGNRKIGLEIIPEMIQFLTPIILQVPFKLSIPSIPGLSLEIYGISMEIKNPEDQSLALKAVKYETIQNYIDNFLGILGRGKCAHYSPKDDLVNDFMHELDRRYPEVTDETKGLARFMKYGLTRVKFEFFSKGGVHEFPRFIPDSGYKLPQVRDCEFNMQIQEAVAGSKSGLNVMVVHLR